MMSWRTPWCPYYDPVSQMQCVIERAREYEAWEQEQIATERLAELEERKDEEDNDRDD